MTSVFVGFVLATILIATASRLWRRNAIPWATIVFFVAAVNGFPMAIIVATAVISLLIESWRRPESLVESLIPMAIATIATVPDFRGLSSSFLRLVIMYAAALLVLPLSQVGTARRTARKVGTSVEIAAALLLLAASVLITTGLAERLPLLCVVGLAIPLAFPAFFQEDFRRRDRVARLEDMQRVLKTVSPPNTESPSCSHQGLATRLHDHLRPILGHQMTVIAINPAFSPPACTVEAVPADATQLARIRERTRFLFISGRLRSLTEAYITPEDDPLQLLPGFGQQLLIPIWKEHHVYALVAFLGHHPFVTEAEAPHLSEAVTVLMHHALTTMEQQQKLRFLEKQAEQQGRRLRHLLELNQLVSASPDLYDLSQNLVRAVSVAFGFTWAGFMLRDQRRRDVRLLSWAGESSAWEWPDDIS
ncbi:MAG TPA: hypothetical protein ENK19_12200, partial [Acidobacteria bacterium]|nr:hypothetical protein [Acidobacteriota bacterium]